MAQKVMCASTEWKFSLQNTRAPQKTEVLLHEQMPQITHRVCSASSYREMDQERQENEVLE